MNGKGYFVVHEWMISELGLKGTDLLVYAIIYGFTQIEEQWFFGSRRYLSEFTGASISSIQRSLDWLSDRGFLKKRVTEVLANGVRLVSYRCVVDPQCQNDTGVKMTHIDNIHNSSNRVSNSSNTKRFTKPTVDEVRDYCQKQGYNINAESFVDFYESKGWLVGKTPMKDWKAAVRTWARNDKLRNSIPQKKLPKVDWGDDD